MSFFFFLRFLTFLYRRSHGDKKFVAEEEGKISNTEINFSLIFLSSFHFQHENFSYYTKLPPKIEALKDLLRLLTENRTIINADSHIILPFTSGTVGYCQTFFFSEIDKMMRRPRDAVSFFFLFYILHLVLNNQQKKCCRMRNEVSRKKRGNTFESISMRQGRSMTTSCEFLNCFHYSFKKVFFFQIQSFSPNFPAASTRPASFDISKLKQHFVLASAACADDDIPRPILAHLLGRPRWSSEGAPAAVLVV